MSAPYYQDDHVTLYHGDCLELADLRRDSEHASKAMLSDALTVRAERDALDAKVERLTGTLIDAGYRAAEDRAEADALRAMLAGRCLSGITHRDEEHRQSVCMLPVGHAPLAHDDCMGCTWTDADHWQPSAVDRVADEVQRIAAESQREGWDGPLVRILVGRISAALGAES